MTPRLLAVLIAAVTATPLHAESIEWRNGRWFDGTSFQHGSRVSVDGMFVDARPATIDRVVDLGDRHVVPPFGDAHHHGIDSLPGLDAKIDAFLDAGIFYVKNPNVIPDLLVPEVRAAINTRDSIDVVFSNGGLTSTGGHPAPLHDRLAARGVFKPLTQADMPGRAYFIIDTLADLEREWPRIRAGRPDFIKTFLLFSDPVDDAPGARTNPHRGLAPALLDRIVQVAHRDGLRVTAHVDTAADFRHAVDADVDEITHLPMPDVGIASDLSPYVIDAATARLAATRGITVVATANVVERLLAPAPVADRARIHANQRANLRLLHDAGVPIAIGSDGISGEQPMVTALDEALYLHRNGMFDARELLRMWTGDTARTIFPTRRIGRLDAGYEASFLVLDANPLVDFDAVRRIGMRVKQGLVMDAIGVIPDIR